MRREGRRLAKLLTHGDCFEPGPVPFGAWLMRVAHNAAVDHLRRGSCASSALARAIVDHLVR